MQARLTGAEWQEYARPATLRTTCTDAVDTREKALELLTNAGGDCLDKALRAVERYAKDDLAAAYLTRFERKRDPDPIDLLHALETAEGFNRALAQEWLYLTKEAIHSWNEVAAEKSGWGEEALEHRQRLQRLPDPLAQWSTDEFDDALHRRDRATLTKMAHAFPTNAARYFERSDLSDRAASRLYAEVLATTGERFPLAVVEAMEHPKDRAALEAGLAAFKKDMTDVRAAELLERAENPLSLVTRYYDADIDTAFRNLRPDYRELSSRLFMLHAFLLEGESRYLDAHPDYDQALAVALGDPTTIADILARRSANFRFIGNPEEAFRDAFRAVSLLDRVSDTDARHQSYGTAADAAELLGNPLVALYYRNAAVETIQRAVVNARAKELSARKHHLAIALRTRAETLIALGRSSEAEEDLQQGADLSEAIEKPEDRDELRMYLREVRGQKLLADAPAEAAAWFTEAIKLAKNADSTYRATLFFERAAAWRKAHNPRADADIASASELLRNEVRSALTRDPSSASKPLWDPYFSRFRDRFDELIESRITADDKEGAFVQAELARAFEPMQILLPVRPIETTADLRRLRALPEDTVILQFLVLPQRTYTWVITREKIQLVTQAVEKSKIERWVTNALDAIASLQSRPFENATRAAYGELFRTPLKIAGPSKTRVVIVPDGPMHGLPFNALGSNEEGYLIKRASISVAGSTSLYLYALTRDRQLAANAHPSVVLVADPPSKEFPPLPAARQEVSDLARDDYPGAEVLTGAGATVANFLKAAKHATILHFAGHSVANPQFPWQSRLLLAADGEASGELTAQKLMQELPSLPRTRLVVLGACSTAGGGSVGPQGLAPLVRPFIAANVPAVVGALWDVRDASAKRLLVSLHCHYRHGDDVAVALRQAQLERLRDNDPATAWAAFQVAGYAASPYPRSPALEDPSIEHLCTANSLLGPDGLHSQ